MFSSRAFFTLLAVVLVCFVAGEASAHGEGLALSSQSGSYHVDVDYDESRAYAERNGQFTFRLFEDEARTRPVDISDVWVRIEQKLAEDDSRTLFTGFLGIPEVGAPSMQYVFPEKGEYLLRVRYYGGVDGDLSVSFPLSEEIASSSFPLMVEKPSRNWFSILGNLDFLKGCIAGGILVLAAAFGYRRHAS